MAGYYEIKGRLMKWLKIVLVSLLIGAALPLVVETPSPVSADVTNADVLITVTPGFGIPGLITGFTLTDLGAITVTGNWTVPVSATHVMIRSARDDYPSTTTTGELMYYGDNTTENWTGFSLETTAYYFSLWTYNATSGFYSSTYLTASVGGEGMEVIAESIGDLTVTFESINSTLLFIVELVLILGLLFLAFTRKESDSRMILFLVSGIVTILVAAGWASEYPGIACVLGGFSIFMIIKSLLIAMQSGGQARGFSQFRGVWNQIKGVFSK